MHSRARVRTRPAFGEVGQLTEMVCPVLGVGVLAVKVWVGDKGGHDG